MDTRSPVPYPFIKSPYTLGTSTLPGVVIPAGQRNVPLLQSDFSLSLEWPFLVEKIVFRIDPQHTYRDVGVRVVDNTFNQEWMKAPVLVDALVQANVGFYDLREPDGSGGWIIRSQGGGQNWFVDNLDDINPITFGIWLEGNLLIPKRGE